MAKGVGRASVAAVSVPVRMKWSMVVGSLDWTFELPLSGGNRWGEPEPSTLWQDAQLST